jgi:hypothetical protein
MGIWRLSEKVDEVFGDAESSSPNRFNWIGLPL